VAASLSGRVIPISSQTAAPGGVYVVEGILYDGLDGAAVKVGSIADIATLRGVHNWQNAAAAYAAARLLGLESAAIFSAFADFAGLPHRLEIIASQAGVTFINDSKATNTDSAARALQAIDGDIYWIAGGLLKETNLDGLGAALGNVRKAYLIGEAAPELAQFLKNRVAVAKSGSLQAATKAAARDAATKGGTVLLSPACASFDQFSDFEARGDAFRAIVAELTKGDAA
jgi:UDP-N-acetylmuramoylalanine--D-glutamate ligase